MIASTNATSFAHGRRSSVLDQATVDAIAADVAGGSGLRQSIKARGLQVAETLLDLRANHRPSITQAKADSAAAVAMAKGALNVG